MYHLSLNKDNLSIFNNIFRYIIQILLSNLQLNLGLMWLELVRTVLRQIRLSATWNMQGTRVRQR